MIFNEIRIKIYLLLIGMGIVIMSFGFNNEKVQDSSTPEQILNRIQLPTIPDKNYNLLDFGAIADGKFDCKPAIDSAIVVINQNGGGRLIIPKGDFLVNGPIHLKSHINLHLEKGSKVFFSQNPKHYLPMQLVRWEGVEVYNYSPYIYAIHETDIAITGQGTFIGQGEVGITEWRPKQKPDQNRLRDMGKQLVPLKERLFGEGHYLRMSFIQLMHCTNIRISDITIEDVPF